MSENTTLVKVEENMLAEISPYQLKANDLLERSKDVEVENEQQVAAAVALKKEITAHRSLVQQTRLSITRQIDGLKKAIMGKEAEVLEPLAKAQEAVGSKVLAYREEQERQKRMEEERIGKLVDSVSISESAVYRIKTVPEAEEALREIKSNMGRIPKADKYRTVIAVAYNDSYNLLVNRITFLEEQARQEAERKELDKKAAAQAAKERRIKAREDKLRREEEQADLERKAAVERKAEEQAEKNKVKTGARTQTIIEVVNADKVPREYCTPDLSKIRAAVEAGATVPGVFVDKVKKL